MKKRGFTLIELLAVIVVLAIIALIATPIVMNVIKDAQKGAAERSAERYVNAVEMALAADRLENDMLKDGIYTVDATGNLVLDDKTLTVAVSGDKPASGSKVAIKNGQVVKDGTNMSIGDYTVTINDKGSATAKEKAPAVALCKAIAPTEEYLYYAKCNEECWDECEEDCWWDDELDDEICDGNEVCVEVCENICNYEPFPTIVGVQATKEAPYAPGTVYSCDLGDGPRTFYVLKEESENIKLIMSENIGSTVTWCDRNGDNPNDNICAADGATAYLASKTSGWTKLKEIGGTVELPDAQDIADVMGDTEWNDANYTSMVGPIWMQTNLEGGFFDDGELPYGYWTSTPYPESSSFAWYVNCSGRLDYVEYDADTLDIIFDGANGVRPVITISKENISL